ncbi:MAG: InlB B-repeat-containing protein, partial [archaeon]
MLRNNNFKKLIAVAVIFVTAFLLVGCEEDTTQYTIMLDPGQGQLSENEQQIVATEGTSISLPEPERDNHYFRGWYTDSQYSNEFDRTKMSSSDMTLFAKWEPYPEITFEMHGGQEIEPIIKPHGEKIETPDDPYKKGHSFVGWFVDGDYTEEYEFDTMPEDDLELHAKWEINEYDITYNLNDGINGDNPEAYNVESSTITLDDPKKEGYTFKGWFDNAEFTGDEIKEIEQGSTEDITLYAEWEINEYDITYNLKDGINGDNPETYTVESETITLEDPKKEGHTFKGWFANAEFTGDEITEIQQGSIGDVTLYAEWEKNDYSITFDSKGGNKIEDITEDFDSEIEEPVPEREGYSFEGWYQDKEYKKAFEFDSMPADNLDLIAKWQIINYDITYNLDDGNNGNNPETYTVESETITLDDPEKQGHTFKGWFDNDEFTGEELTEIQQGSAENLKLYAKWEINEYKVSYGVFSDHYNPENRIPLNPGESIKKMVSGNYYSAALTTEGRVFTW